MNPALEYFSVDHPSIPSVTHEFNSPAAMAAQEALCKHIKGAYAPENSGNSLTYRVPLSAFPEPVLKALETDNPALEALELKEGCFASVPGQLVARFNKVVQVFTLEYHPDGVMDAQGRYTTGPSCDLGTFSPVAQRHRPTGRAIQSCIVRSPGDNDPEQMLDWLCKELVPQG